MLPKMYSKIGDLLQEFQNESQKGEGVNKSMQIHNLKVEELFTEYVMRSHFKHLQHSEGSFQNISNKLID